MKPLRSHIFVRIILLTAMLTVFDLWLNRHTGHGIEDPRALGGIIGIILVFVGILKTFISINDAAVWQQWISKGLNVLLDFRSIALMASAAFFVMISFTSITVLPSDDENKVTISPITYFPGNEKNKDETSSSPINASEGDDTFEMNQNPVRRIVTVGPFGRGYRIKLNGYMPLVMNVFPFFGAIIDPEKDMTRSPTILIRPPINALKSLRQCEPIGGSNENDQRCGYFKICLPDTDENRVKCYRVEHHSGAFLIGWPLAVPRDLSADWQLELIAYGLSPSDKLFAQTLLDWKSIKEIDSRNLHVNVGDSVSAEVFSKSEDEERVAQITFTVPNQPFLDLKMISE
jgi:hypothetical protein